jgi:Flp pilus assembly protein TadD
LIDKYQLNDDDVLSPENTPNWIFETLQHIRVDGSFDQAELLQLRKSTHKYLAAAVHWRAWELASDPWNVVHSCSLLRQAGEPQKAVKLLSKIDISGWNNTVVSAYFTTLGGAQRDASLLSEAWHSASTAVLQRDDKPHPYLLLGALCYQLNRHEEGDNFFVKARERGATEKDIEFTQRDAELRRRKPVANDTL